MQKELREGSPLPKIRVGLLGIGNWAIRGHIPVLKLLPQYDLVAIQSSRKDHVDAIAKRFGIARSTTSITEVAEHPEIDLVAVLTAAPQHADAVQAVLAAGKDVYCEWPLTTNTKLAIELLELARNAGGHHVIGLQRRLAPTFRYLRDLLEQGYAGKVRSVRMHISMNYFQRRRSNALRWTIPPENFSNAISIYGGHFMDALFTATGWPGALAALLINQFNEITIEETGEAFSTTTPDQLLLTGLIAKNAVVSVHVESGKRNNAGVQIDVTGEDGDLLVRNSSAFGDIGDDYVIEGAQGEGSPLQRLPVPPSYNWVPPSNLPSSVIELANLYAAYAKDLSFGTHWAPTFSDGLRMHRLLDEAKSSSDAARWTR
jgi:predicted dehydrogenase